MRERRSSVVDGLLRSSELAHGGRLKHAVAQVTQGWSPQCLNTPSDGINEWAVLKAGAVNRGIFRSSENKELPAEETPRPDLVVRRGQLIVSRANTRELVGSAAVISGEYPRLMLSDKLYAFTLDDSMATPRYVAYVLGTRQYRDLIELEATGASPSMQNVTLKDIMNLPMALPPLHVQQEVTEDIDRKVFQLDDLLARSATSIDLASERRQALIAAAVTGGLRTVGDA